MAEAEGIKGTVQDGITKYIPQYPYDPEDLATYYANHVQIAFLSEEVYLDLCQLQPQNIDVADIKAGHITALPSRVEARIILGRRAAANLAKNILLHFGWEVKAPTEAEGEEAQ